MTPEQEKSLQTFTYQRDELNRQIMVLRGQFETLDAKCKEAESARTKALLEKIGIDKELQMKVDFIFDLLAKLEERIKTI